METAVEGDYVDFMCSDLTISANDAWDNSKLRWKPWHILVHADMPKA